jgi:hypothetical protein
MAHQKDAIRVPLEIAKDLISGMTEEEVAKKPYKYTLEMYFYTQKENVPSNNPHWFIVNLLNLDKFLESESKLDEGRISVKVVQPKE